MEEEKRANTSTQDHLLLRCYRYCWRHYDCTSKLKDPSANPGIRQTPVMRIRIDCQKLQTKVNLNFLALHFEIRPDGCILETQLQIHRKHYTQN